MRRPVLLGLLWGVVAGLSSALQAELAGRVKTTLGLGPGPNGEPAVPVAGDGGEHVILNASPPKRSREWETWYPPLR